DACRPLRLARAAPGPAGTRLVLLGMSTIAIAARAVLALALRVAGASLVPFARAVLMAGALPATALEARRPPKENRLRLFRRLLGRFRTGSRLRRLGGCDGFGCCIRLGDAIGALAGRSGL